MSGHLFILRHNDPHKPKNGARMDAKFDSLGRLWISDCGSSPQPHFFTLNVLVIMQRRLYMRPDKKKIINGKKVEQYYWAGKNVVYIDNYLQKGQTFEEVCADLEEEGAYEKQCDNFNKFGAL